MSKARADSAQSHLTSEAENIIEQHQTTEKSLNAMEATTLDDSNVDASVMDDTIIDVSTTMDQHPELVPPTATATVAEGQMQGQGIEDPWLEKNQGGSRDWQSEDQEGIPRGLDEVQDEPQKGQQGVQHEVEKEPNKAAEGTSKGHSQVNEGQRQW